MAEGTRKYDWDKALCPVPTIRWLLPRLPLPDKTIEGATKDSADYFLETIQKKGYTVKQKKPIRKEAVLCFYLPTIP